MAESTQGQRQERTSLHGRQSGVQRIRSVYDDFMGEHDQSYYPDFSTPCAMLWHADCEGFLRRRGKWDVPCACYCHDESSVL